MSKFRARAFFWIGLAVLVAYGAWWFAPQYLASSPDPRSEEFLSKVAAEINRAAPVMIDPETELLGAVGSEGTLTYRYRMVNYAAAQVNPERFRRGATQRVAQAACSTPETRDAFLKKGVTLEYAYFDKERAPIATIAVRPADCGF
ncbi:MAG TPA: hypothetical protein VNO43_16150 [Candidatus Eisenbacteria bacterium]|nr:hypothetical protein [Candidatus Eisenbacteria bacterium]